MLPARNRGSITVEIIIAFAVFSLVLTSVILLMSGEDSGALARATQERMLAASFLEGEAHADFFSLTSTSSIAVHDISPCLKELMVSVGSMILLQPLADASGMIALGGDCAYAAPSAAWTTIKRIGSGDVPGGTGTAVDVRDGTAYLGVNEAPFFLIADSDHIIQFQNNFALSTYPNALDAVRIQDSDYVYLAMNGSTSQLAVIDVRDDRNPVLTAMRTLAGVDQNGSFPEGWRVKYYDERVYVTTRETKGAELHIFDASHPETPNEIGTTALDITLNDFEIRNEYPQGVLHRFLYAATARDSGEIAVYDVTNPLAVFEVMKDRIDLPGAQDGDSVALVGTRLYFGRESAPSGPDVYVYDASSTATSLALLGSADVGTGVPGMSAVGSFAFLATLKSGKQVQVWSIADPAHMKVLATYALPGLPARGLDYENDRVYGVGNSAPLLQILSGN